MQGVKPVHSMHNAINWASSLHSAHSAHTKTKEVFADVHHHHDVSLIAHIQPLVVLATAGFPLWGLLLILEA